MNMKKGKQQNDKWTFEQKVKMLEYCAFKARVSVCDVWFVIEQDRDYNIETIYRMRTEKQEQGMLVL